MIIDNPINTKEWVFTNSQITLFKNCRQKYYFSYIQLLQPNIIVKPLFLGGLVHEGIAVYYNNKQNGLPLDAIKNNTTEIISFLVEKKRKELDNAYENINEDKEEELDLLQNQTLSILDNYITFAEENDEWELIITEKEFEIELDLNNRKIKVKIKVDGIVKRKDGTMWLLEHKTTSAKDFIEYKKKLELDEQVNLYIYVISRLHPEWNIVGVIYNILRKKTPSIPKIKKDNTISKASCDTTYDIFLNTIRENNLNPEDYLDTLENLKHNKFVDRELIYRTPEHLESFFQEWQETLKALTSPKLLIYKNPWACKNFNCSYHPLCVEDTKEIREFNFHIKEKPNIELSDHENI